jgi:TfoX/Sxy family transcriptional regulator of competence genes
MPRASDDAKQAFLELVPMGPGVTTKPMFGHMAAFVNGNMFTGLFGDDLFVRVGESDRATLLQKGGHDFEPMAGRPMSGYVVLPAGWSKATADTRKWMDLALEATGRLPAKQPKPKRATPARSRTAR